MAEVSPLPIRGEVVVDARGGERALRVSWHPEHGARRAVDLARQHLRRTVQVDSAEVPHLVDVLVRGLAASSAPAPGSTRRAEAEAAGQARSGSGSGSAWTTVSSETARVSTT